MADIIQLLPDHVANQIAAGEVIQRPASVVKELMENAIDAGAKEIKLVIKDAGKTLVQVIDNGTGMSVTDARLSFERHATSKIRSAEDLFKINSRGFRGEALASIAAVAHVEMNTRQDRDEVGTQLKIEGRKVISQDVAAVAKGTSVAVKNLFFNIPARRNFLKSDKVELRHIIDEFHRIALARPGIHFNMYHNGSELFNLPETNLRQRIVNVFGTKTNERLVPVSEDTEVVNISGFVCKPAHARKSRGEQFFFVNNRFIKSPYLHHAVVAAFEGLIKERTHPGYFLFLEVDPASIDINIHPTKTEIKFDDEHTIYSILRSTIKHGLGQFSVAPVLDFEKDPNLDTPYHYKNKKTAPPTIEFNANFNPFKETAGSDKKTASNYKTAPVKSWESLYTGLNSKPEAEQSFGSIALESEDVTGTLFTEEEQKAVNYQLHGKYVITTIKSGMVIIHQRRAHQRILYEKFLANITIQQATSQQLLFPLQLNFSLDRIRLLEQLKERLEFTGFIFKLNEETVEISGIPVNMPENDIPDVLEQLLSDFEEGIPDNGFSQTDFFARSLCKTLAIRTGESLNRNAREALVNSLFACKEPTVSPFGKLVYITMTLDELDKKF